MKRESVLGLFLVAFWAYLSFFSYPSAAWVNNSFVHVINWDSFSNWYVDGVEDSAGFDVVVLTEPGQEVVDSLLNQGRSVLVLTNDSSGCSDNVCYMPQLISDADYKYPLFYLSGRVWLYYLNLVAPLFLLLGLIFLREVLYDKRFALVVIFLFSLLGARKYIVGMSVAPDLPFHISKLGFVSQGSVITDLLASGITTWHYYPPLFYWFWSLFVHFVGLVGTVKLLVFFTIFLSGISAYALVRNLTGTKYATIIAIIYMLSPYLLSDTNLRGGLSEAFCFFLIPLVFLSLVKMMGGSRKYAFLFVTFLSMLILTHIPTTVIVLISSLIFVFSFEGDTKKKIKAFSYVFLALLVASFWVIPLLIELDFTSHDGISTGISIVELFIPKDWNCEGLCMMESMYVGIVLFSLSVLGVIITFLSKNKKPYEMSLIWLFVFWSSFLAISGSLFELVPLMENILQHSLRSFTILTLLCVLFAAEVFDRLHSIKKFGAYICIILLFLLIMDSYKITGARVHSNDPEIALFSLDGFQIHFDDMVTPEEMKSAISRNPDSRITIILEPEYTWIGTFFGHKIMPQVSAASLVDVEASGPFPRESSSRYYDLLWQEAYDVMVYTEIGENPLADSERLMKLVGYSGSDILITTSDRYSDNACGELLETTENLYIYNNTCALGKVSVYSTAVNIVQGDVSARISEPRYMNYVSTLFKGDGIDPSRFLLVKSEEPLDVYYDYHVYIGDYLEYPDLGEHISDAEPDINVSITSWEDESVQLQVDAGEDGFVMLRKNAYPDWELYVDGNREEILLAEPSFIAFRIVPGEHDVRLVYTYFNWRHLLGLAVSLLGLILLAVSLLYWF